MAHKSVLEDMKCLKEQHKVKDAVMAELRTALQEARAESECFKQKWEEAESKLTAQEENINIGSSVCTKCPAHENKIMNLQEELRDYQNLNKYYQQQEMKRNEKRVHSSNSQSSTSSHKSSRHSTSSHRSHHSHHSHHSKHSDKPKDIEKDIGRKNGASNGVKAPSDPRK